MRDTNLLQLALGLTPPWTVSRADFDPEAQRLDIEIDFAPGSRFACPSCGVADCPAYDTERKTWRHLNFFQHQAYLNARVPRVRCEACGIKTVSVPWARPRQWLHPAVRGAADDHDLRHAGQGRRRDGGRTRHQAVARGSPLRRPGARTHASDVTQIAIDETAARRGHDYITLFVDIDRARVLFATEGRDAEPSPRSPTISPRMAVTPRRSTKSAST